MKSRMLLIVLITISVIYPCMPPYPSNTKVNQVSNDTIIKTVTYYDYGTTKIIRVTIDTIVFGNFKKALTDYCNSNSTVFWGKVISCKSHENNSGTLESLSVQIVKKYKDTFDKIQKDTLIGIRTRSNGDCRMSGSYYVGKNYLGIGDSTINPLQQIDIFLGSAYLIDSGSIVSHSYDGFKIPVSFLDDLFTTRIKMTKPILAKQKPLINKHSYFYELNGRIHKKNKNDRVKFKRIIKH